MTSSDLRAADGAGAMWRESTAQRQKKGKFSRNYERRRAGKKAGESLRSLPPSSSLLLTRASAESVG